MVAEYRAAMAEHVAEPAWKCLVARLTEGVTGVRASSGSGTRWRPRRTGPSAGCTRRSGLLELNYTNLWLGQRLGTRMTTYTPADERTAERLRELAGLPSPHQVRCQAVASAVASAAAS